MAHCSRPLYRALMRIAVWNMKWMTRYLAFIARPLVRLYGMHEVIACGMRGHGGAVEIIYTPHPGNHHHRLALLGKDGAWSAAEALPLPHFSGTRVTRMELLGAEEGNVCKVRAETARGRTLSSPTIYVKKTSVRSADMLSAAACDNGDVVFSWSRAERFSPMIYFLVVENGRGETNAAVYTREMSFRYPRLGTASYSVGPDNPPRFIPGEHFVAKLLVVDYDGWVSHLAERMFVMNRAVAPALPSGGIQ